jgi:hypothetical protein
VEASAVYQRAGSCDHQGVMVSPRARVFLALLCVASAGCEPESGCAGDCNSGDSVFGVCYGTDLLIMALANYAISCADPVGHKPRCEYWEVGVHVPAALFVPGPVDLHSPEVSSGFEAGSSKGSNCLVNGGTPFIGDFAIETIDAQEVVVDMTNNDSFADIPSGTFSLTRCP